MTNWKGSKPCCCGGCHVAPKNVNLAATAIQIEQQYCCTCVPLQACVVAYCYTSESSTVLANKSCSVNYNDESILYEVELGINNELLDLIFRFVVEDGICYLCLESQALSLTATPPSSNCIEINATQRGNPTQFCHRLFIDEMPATWEIPNSPICNGGTLYIELVAASNTPINPRNPCTDAYGNVVEDTDPIKDICGNCSCICTCTCITVIHVNNESFSDLACLGDTYDEFGVPDTTAWSVNGVTIRLSGDYTDCCQLELVETGGVTLAVDPEPVAIDRTGNPCPNPEARWDLIDTNGDPYIVLFNCASCETCNIPITSCCNGSLPRLLTATLSVTGCACLSLTVPLIYDPLAEWWTGTASSSCGQDIEITFSCTGTEWQLSFDGTPCVVAPGTLNNQAGDCNPLSISFGFQISGIGCCGGGDMGTLRNATVTVTE